MNETRCGIHVNEGNLVYFDFVRLMKAVIKGSWVVVLTGIVFFAAAWFLVPKVESPVYTSTYSVFVTLGDRSTGDILEAAKQDLTNTYQALAQSSDTLRAARKLAKKDTGNAIDGLVTAERNDVTQIVTIHVNSGDSESAYVLSVYLQKTLDSKMIKTAPGTEIHTIQSPTNSTAPSSPNRKKASFIACGTGILLMIFILMIREALNRKVRDPRMLEEQFGISVIGIVPKKISKEEEAAYDNLRAKILLRLNWEERSVIVVTSPGREDSAEETAGKIARSFAKLDGKTLLVDADLRTDGNSAESSSKEDLGLSDVLEGKVMWREAICQKISSHMDFLSSGSPAEFPMDLIQSRKFESLLEELKFDYDYLILSLPPMEEGADAVVAGAKSSGLILVLQDSISRIPKVEKSLKELVYGNIPVLGCIYLDTLTGRRK